MKRALTPVTVALPRSVRGPSWLFRRVLSSLRRDERGTAMVEFALVSIPLFLVVFGILDFGRAMNYYNDMNQLAGQGARAASVNLNVNGTTADSTFQQLLKNNADSSVLKAAGNGVKVCVTTAGAFPNRTVNVTVSYNFNFIPLVHAGALPLSASQTVRFEANAPTYNDGCYGP